MDKFVAKEPHVSSNNQSQDQGLTVDNNVDPDVDNDHRDEQAEKENNDEVDDDLIGKTDIDMDNNGDDIGTTSIDVNSNTSPVADVGGSFHVNIFDPRNWGSLDPKQIDILAQKALKETHNFKKVLRTDILAGFLHYSILELCQMGSIVIEIGLSILRTSIEYFALVVNYLQKGIGKLSWQTRGVMIEYILAEHLKSMRQV